MPGRWGNLNDSLANLTINFPTNSGTLTLTRADAYQTAIVCIQHRGGTAYLVGVWMVGSFYPLASSGSVFAIQSVTTTELVISSNDRYVYASAFATSPVSLSYTSN